MSCLPIKHNEVPSYSDYFQQIRSLKQMMCVEMLMICLFIFQGSLVGQDLVEEDHLEVRTSHAFI